MINSVKLIMAVGLLIASRVAVAQDPVHENSSMEELVPVFFKKGFPCESGSSALSSVEDAEQVVRVLEENLRLIQEQAEKRVRVIGSTDDKECSGSECAYLSVRRALFVQTWLVDHGVAKFRFDPIIVLGQDFPASENNSESGRGRNRRAEVEFLY